MEQRRATTLRRLLAGSALPERAVGFGSQLRTTAGPGGLLLVGTPHEEPWHLAAHLTDDAHHAGLPELVPTLVRHQVPEGTRPHLAVGLDRLAGAGRSSTLLVVATDDPGERRGPRAARRHPQPSPASGRPAALRALLRRR